MFQPALDTQTVESPKHFNANVQKGKNQYSGMISAVSPSTSRFYVCHHPPIRPSLATAPSSSPSPHRTWPNQPLSEPISCVQLHVGPQGDVGLVVLAAHRAPVGGFPCVGLLVVHQLGAPRETLPTVGAFVGPFTCMKALVSDEVGAPPETFPAILAGVGSLPSVDALVHGEVLPPGKAFPTAEADIGFFPRVDPVVGQEAAALAEALPAVQALIGFFPPVELLVGDEVRMVAEAPPALGALVGMLLSVRHQVPAQVVLPIEGFPTLAAPVHFFLGAHPSLDPSFPGMDFTGVISHLPGMVLPLSLWPGSSSWSSPSLALGQMATSVLLSTMPC